MSGFEEIGGICVPDVKRRRRSTSTEDAVIPPVQPAGDPSPLPSTPSVTTAPPSPPPGYHQPPPRYFPHPGYGHPSFPIGGLDPLYLLLLNGGLTGGGIGEIALLIFP